MEWFARLQHRLTLWWGRKLDRIRLNSIRVVDVDGVPYVAKRRHWYAPFLIVLGNFYLRRIGASTRFLPNHAWQAWESEVYRAAYGHLAQTEVHVTGCSNCDSGCLLLPRWSGTTLRDYFASCAHCRTEKQRAVGLAAEELNRLHQLRVRWPDGQLRYFSHGDATVRNVILIEAPLQAKWIDFDMGHVETQPDTWRQADDLRAMLFSAAKWFPPESYGELAEITLGSYGNWPVVERLAENLVAPTCRPNSFQLAQSGLTYDQYRQLNAAVLESARAEGFRNFSCHFRQNV